MALINCDECGNEVSDKAENCPNCGAPVDIKDVTDNNESPGKKAGGHNSDNSKLSPKRGKTAENLAFLGVIYIHGVHRFYVGRWITGLFQLFTFGGLWIWTGLDLYDLERGRFADSEGKSLKSPGRPLITIFMIFIGVIIFMPVVLSDVENPRRSSDKQTNSKKSSICSDLKNADSVRDVQKSLNSYGKDLKVDNIWGANTKNAVKNECGKSLASSLESKFYKQSEREKTQYKDTEEKDTEKEPKSNRDSRCGPNIKQGWCDKVVEEAKSHIRLRGFQCREVDRISTWFTEKGYTVKCDGYQYKYYLRDHGGNWEVEVVD